MPITFSKWLVATTLCVLGLAIGGVGWAMSTGAAREAEAELPAGVSPAKGPPQPPPIPPATNDEPRKKEGFQWDKLDPFIEKATQADPADTPLRKLQKDRCHTRAYAVAQINEVIRIGRWQREDFEGFMKLQTTLFENLAELMDKQADKVKCLEMRVAAFKEFETFIERRTRTGTDPPQNLQIAKAARIDAEIELLKLKE